ncbi:hypothetical protein SDC9_180487 [bioreactor metagenome]|uniref:Uncharacterized protein n=1 Tax=bioreactor metagenome TaxID=1076179 RepID=A0A645HA72_9ZZZZ
MKLFGRNGVHPAQFLQKGGDAIVLQPGLQLRPNGAARHAGGKAVAPQQRVQPQPGAAHQNGALAPGQNVFHHRRGGGDISGGGPALFRVRHGKHMVGDSLRLLRRGGGGSDGHAPVNLHGVAGDDLSVVCLGQQDAQPRFSAGGGAHHADELFRHISSPDPAG